MHQFRMACCLLKACICSLENLIFLPMVVKPILPFLRNVNKVRADIFNIVVTFLLVKNVSMDFLSKGGNTPIPSNLSSRWWSRLNSSNILSWLAINATNKLWTSKSDDMFLVFLNVVFFLQN